MGNLLDTPNKGKDSESYTTSSGLSCGSSGMQGWRLEMEDSHLIMDMPSRQDHTFVAVFDGHGGAGAAAYAAANMIRIIEETDQWNEYIKGGATDMCLLEKTLKLAFMNIDEALKIKQNGDVSDSSGCTSVTAMITPKYIICANAGDSRCVMGTDKLTKAMSEDHKPNNDSERRRIELAGGRVQWKRVDGDLAVSRALGDFQYKTRTDLGPENQKVSCEPDFVIHERTDSDEMLLLACDGLWDVMSNEEAVKEMRNIFADGGNVMTKVCEEMLDIALHAGSKDNISAVIVQLPGAFIGVKRQDNIKAKKSFISSSKSRISSKSDDEDMGSPPSGNL